MGVKIVHFFISFSTDFGRIVVPSWGPFLKTNSFWQIFWVYNLESDFVTILEPNFNGFFNGFLCILSRVVEVCCIFANLRECMFSEGETEVREIQLR